VSLSKQKGAARLWMKLHPKQNLKKKKKWGKK
jgi:hypothetical protein